MDVDARDARASAATRASIGHVMLAIDTKVRARARRARAIESRARASRDSRDLADRRARARGDRGERDGTRKMRRDAMDARERTTDGGSTRARVR